MCAAELLRRGARGTAGAPIRACGRVGGQRGRQRAQRACRWTNEVRPLNSCPPTGSLQEPGVTWSRGATKQKQARLVAMLHPTIESG